MTQLLVVFALIGVAIALPARAGEVSGDAGASTSEFLRLGVGAAAVAQGEAFAGRSGSIESLHYNPAGLALMRRPAVQFQHNKYLLDMKSEYLAVVLPREKWTFGVSLSYLDYGDFTRRTILNPEGTGTFGASAITGSAAGAYQITRNLSVGAAIRGYEEELDNASRNGVTGTFGLHYRFAERGSEIGLVVRNFGRKVHFDRDEEDVPLEAAFGVTIPFMEERLRFSGELVKPRDQRLDWRGGLEIRPLGPLALRAGYDSRNDLGKGYTYGAGFAYRDMTLDYAYVPFSLAGDAHRGSLTVAFGSTVDRDSAVDHVKLLSTARFRPLNPDRPPSDTPATPGSSYFSVMKYGGNAVEYVEGPDDKKWIATAADDLVRARIMLSHRDSGDRAITYSGGCAVIGNTVYLEVAVIGMGETTRIVRRTAEISNIIDLWRGLEESLDATLES